MWTVTVDKDVARKLKRIPEPEKGRIKAAILSLEYQPEVLDIKPLVGRDGYRLRVGDWRLILDIDTERKVISVYTLASRGDIYKKK